MAKKLYERASLVLNVMSDSSVMLACNPSLGRLRQTVYQFKDSMGYRKGKEGERKGGEE